MNYYLVISEEGIHAVCESEEFANELIKFFGKGKIVVKESSIDPENFIWTCASDRSTYPVATDNDGISYQGKQTMKIELVNIELEKAMAYEAGIVAADEKHKPNIKFLEAEIARLNLDLKHLKARVHNQRIVINRLLGNTVYIDYEE